MSDAATRAEARRGRARTYRLGDRLQIRRWSSAVIRTGRFAVATAALAITCWILARAAGLELRAPSPRLFAAVGVGLGLVIVGAARGNAKALFFAVLFGVPLELPVAWELRSEATVLRRGARWLLAFLREPPRGHNTPGGHRACGLIATKKLLKEASLRRERRTPGLRALEQRRERLVKESHRVAQATFRVLCQADEGAAELSRRQHELDDELARIDTELFHRRLAVQTTVVDAFLRTFGRVKADEAALHDGSITDADHRAVLDELQQPANEAPALLPRGLVHGGRAMAFEYGMFFGRLAMALLFVSTCQGTFLLISLLLFCLDLYVVEPVVFKLYVGAMNALLEVRGQKMADCRREIAASAGGAHVFRVPIIVPKFSSNPAATQLAAIIKAALRRAGVGPVQMTPFAMRLGERRTVLELAEASAPELERRGAALRAALRAELDAARGRFPLDVELEQDGARVSLVLTDEDRTIWDVIGEDASQAFVYLWKNLRALVDTLDHLGPRFQPVFILASNSDDPDIIDYEIARLAELQRWSNARLHGQVGFLYLLRGGAWYGYNARLRRFDASDRDFAAAFVGIEASLAAPDCPLLVPGAESPALGDVARRKQVAGALNGLLGDPELHRRFDAFAFDALPAHRRPTAATRGLLDRRRAGQKLTTSELLDLNRELLFTALPMRGRGSFFKKVGNDIAVHELLVAGKTRPTVYTDRRVHEHVQDGGLPNYRRVWGDFARYTGLRGSNHEIEAAILAGEDLAVDSVPQLAAIVDDKNSFAPGELEKAIATMLHPENRHVAIGVPRVEVTMPEDKDRTISSAFARDARDARQVHNASDGMTKAGIFDLSSAAYGKWFMRPSAYFAHYALEALDAAHALSHDFQQSYLVAGAAGRLGAFTETLFGPSRFEVSCGIPRAPTAEVAAPPRDAGTGGRAVEADGRLNAVFADLGREGAP